MNDWDDELDDPRLRTAVRRALGRESAPPELRRRIEGLLTGAAAASASSPDREAPRAARMRLVAGPPWKLVAAAAVMLLALGYMVMEVRSEFFPPRATFQVASVASFPASFAQQLVLAHDNCAKLADHHLIGGDDLKALAPKLTADEGVTVFSDTIGDGWTFKGAGVCPVGEKKAAHLLFTRGGESVSIFSLPPPSACTANAAASFEQELDRHALVGFLHDQTFYAVVGSRAGAEMAPAQLQSVVSLIRKCQGAGPCAAGCAAPSAVALARP